MARDLIRLFQKDDSSILRSNDGYGFLSLKPIGKIMTLVRQNPSSPEQVVEDMVKEHSILIPKKAVAYTISDFNGGTQKIVEYEGREITLSVYALQFYSY